ncbi:ribonuclease R [Deinococcus arenicola]|uniref:Ribonuclease R n=1 Tax=Deinococcus arenicola TaxID=2994950 RepID=A0ABU4DQJ2_9DEIO|nr:ribonuclease R [Deinococcus sp. ZS9-10]MDV6374696.1 ribonuclease R [Deinococcus sp. ZS9-10]
MPKVKKQDAAQEAVQPSAEVQKPANKTAGQRSKKTAPQAADAAPQVSKSRAKKTPVQAEKQPASKKAAPRKKAAQPDAVAAQPVETAVIQAEAVQQPESIQPEQTKPEKTQPSAAKRGRKPAKAAAQEAPAQVEATAPEMPEVAVPEMVTVPDMTVPEVVAEESSAGARPAKKPRQPRKAPAATGQAEVQAGSEASEVETPETKAEAPAEAPRRRGRKAAVQVAPEPEVAEAAAPAEPPVMETPVVEAVAEEGAPETVQAEAPRPARRGRKPRQAEEVQAQADEPLILEVPKKTRGRRKTLPDAPLPEVLNGVEAVEFEPEAVHALQVVSASEAVPAVDSTLAVQEASETQPDPKPRGRGGRGKRAQPTPVEEVVQPEPVAAEEAVAAEEEQQEIQLLSPERELVIAQLRKLGRPVHVRDLERTFTRQAINRIGGWRELEELLDTLTDEGQVIRTRKKTYGLPEAMSLVRGRFQASAAGFGFVIPDSGGDDFYVPAEQTLEAWNGDIVLVRMEGRGDSGRSEGGRGGGGPRRGQKGDGSPRASVVRIVQRAYKQLVGTLEYSHGHPILKPDDHRARHRILVLPEGIEELEAGARVVTELFWPENTGEDEVFGQVTRVLGAEDDPETETEAVIVKFGLRGEFPEPVTEQAQAIPTEIPAAALSGRLDLREYNIFTVDGRDAKDFDDAIHIQPTPEGNFVVGVHIADVSHYVQEGTPLDEEAFARATSVYLPGRVLPMLPEHLSNGVCSLVPYQDRLTLTALIELSAEGEILDVKIAPSVINSKARLTYDEVQAYSEATATLPEAARNLEGDLHLLLKITSKLRQKRLREGSLDFKMREVKVDVGKDGRMELIPIREETARGMIEDLMLLANKVVARFLIGRDIPALFRIHEEPTLQRFQDVTAAIGRLGFAFPGGEPTPQAYQAVLKEVRGTNRESVVNTLLLRSMQQAKYSGENLGHFGLAFDEYLHFTSPIRRYPDLLVHRVIKGILSGELKAGNREVALLQSRLPGMGDHTSERERTASEAERDLTKYYQAKWAQEHLGESFPGNVSGVVASGLYVMLDNGVEGKLHISNLDDDYYMYLEDAQMLKGRSRNKSFRLGDSLNVTISTVKPLARQTDFTLADPTDPDYKPGNFNEENDMDSPVKPRARRRDDREQEKREKLQSVPVSEPRKFTLDDPAPAASSSADASPRQGGRGRGGQGNTGSSSQGQSRGQQGQGRTFGGVSMDSNEGANDIGGGNSGAGNNSGPRRGARRVITLERPRNEHLRPVNITVQRMYFGDWTLENMPADDGNDGGGRRDFNRGGRGVQERGSNNRGTAARGERGHTRGGSDRGAVQRPNGRPQGQRQSQSNSQGGGTQQGQAAQPAQVQAAASQPAGVDAAQSDDKRRRRRRGRRGTGTGTE